MYLRILIHVYHLRTVSRDLYTQQKPLNSSSKVRIINYVREHLACTYIVFSIYNRILLRHILVYCRNDKIVFIICPETQVSKCSSHLFLNIILYFFWLVHLQARCDPKDKHVNIPKWIIMK